MITASPSGTRRRAVADPAVARLTTEPSAGRAARDIERPQLAADADRVRSRAARAFSRRPVPVPERGGLHPRLEGVLVPPPGHDQPGGPSVGGLEQLEALEAVLAVHRARPRREPP